jgi:hypothetical protein
MTVETWLAAAQHDAEKRGLRDLAPLLETLGRSTVALRAADEEQRHSERPASPPPSQA